MSFRYPAGLITAGSPVAPQFPSGVWTNQQTLPYIKGQVWANDQYFQNTTLLLHGDGAGGVNNAQFSGFVDNSTNNFPITVNGDAYADNFSPFSLANGYWSNFFDGSGDYLSVSDNVALRFGTGDFAIEFWFNGVIGTTSQFVVSKYSTYTSDMAYVVGILRNNHPSNPRGLQVWIGTTAYEAGSGSIQDNTWYHIAVTRESGSVRLFVNGSQVGTTQTITNDITNTATLRIGASNENDSYTLGSVSNVRLVKGSAVYTSAFTPSTTPLTAIANTSLLTCQSNRFVDNSSNAFAITRNGDVAVSPFTPFTVTPNTTDGSGYFDGSVDSLSIPDNAVFDFGTGDFTLEAWVYINGAISGDQYILSYVSTGTPAHIGLNIYNSGWRLGGFNGQLVTGSTNLTTGQWIHVALVRNGNTLAGYANGVQIGTVSVTGVSFDCAGSVFIGRYYLNNTADFNGYISNVRVVKGTAVYASAFTPPSAPLTAVTNTQLLTCQYQGNVNNNGFIDSGPYDFRITRVGNTTQGSFSPFSREDGYWSNYFDGTGDYLSFANSTDSNSAFGNTVPLTFEFWVYPTSTSWVLGTSVIGSVGNYWWELYHNSSSGLIMNFGRWGYSSASASTGSDEQVPLNKWTHVVWQRRSDNTVDVYYNGIAQTVSNGLGGFSAMQLNGSGTVKIGGGGYYTPGPAYIYNFRFTKSQVYSGNFTPPTTPLPAIANTSVLTCQSNRFKDNSANNFALTPAADTKVTPFSPFPITTAYDPAVNGGSGYFDGTGGAGSNTDSLTIPDNNAFELGSSDFTLEAWIYPTANPTEAIRIVEKEGDASNLSYLFLLLSDEKIGFNYSTNGTSYTQTSSSTSVSLNTWSHVAITRSGSTFTFWINGVSSGTNTASVTIFNSNAVLRIGNASSHDRCFPGYISNLRLVKGTAVYTTAFTPPTAPLTAIANTSFLCNFTNAGIFDNTGFNNLETVGNAQIDTSVKKYGTGAMKFDGSGDYLYMGTSTPSLLLGTAPFTIEFWFNTTSSTRYAQFIGNEAGATTYGFTILINNASATAGDIAIYNGPSALINSATGTSYRDGNWHHLAFVRDSAGSRLYLNGTQQGATNSGQASTSFDGTTFRWAIGANLQYTGRDYLGYIDDLRITKGIARYTTTFTPPIARFPNQ